MANTITMTLDDIEGCKELSNEIVDTRRWVVVHEVVFEHEDKLYRVYYDVAATEMQEGSGTEWNEPLTCTEVKAVEKIIIGYEPV